MRNVFNILYHSLFPRENGNEREFHSRTKAFACLLTMCAGFQMPIPLSVEVGPWRQPDGKCGLSIGWFDWPADLGCGSKVGNHACLYAGNLLMTVLRPLIDNSVWRLSTLVPLILTTLVTGFLPASVKMSSSCLFWTEFGNRSDLLWRSGWLCL